MRQLFFAVLLRSQLCFYFPLCLLLIFAEHDITRLLLAFGLDAINHANNALTYFEMGSSACRDREKTQTGLRLLFNVVGQ
jgi:hypothetical protein